MYNINYPMIWSVKIVFGKTKGKEKIGSDGNKDAIYCKNSCVKNGIGPIYGVWNFINHMLWSFHYRVVSIVISIGMKGWRSNYYN